MSWKEIERTSADYHQMPKLCHGIQKPALDPEFWQQEQCYVSTSGLPQKLSPISFVSFLVAPRQVPSLQDMAQHSIMIQLQNRIGWNARLFIKQESRFQHVHRC